MPPAGAKVYLTLNTLLTDRELPKAAEVAAQASAIGADAVLIQDLGVLRMLRQVAPDLPVHASTQMTLHNLDGGEDGRRSGPHPGGALPGAEPGSD